LTNSDPPEVWTEAVIAMTTSENEEVIGSAIESLIALMDQPEGEEGQEVVRKYTSTMAKKTKFVIGDVCWLISHDEYFEYALPIAQENGDGYIYRGGEQEIELYTGDASAAGWPQDSGILGVLRFDDLEPQYQERAKRLEEGGYVAFFESKAESVFDLRHEELKEQGFFEPEITAEDLEEKEKYWGM